MHRVRAKPAVQQRFLTLVLLILGEYIGHLYHTVVLAFNLHLVSSKVTEFDHITWNLVIWSNSSKVTEFDHITRFQVHFH